MVDTDSSSDRTKELRAALVRSVEATPPRRRVRRRWLVAAIAAFALAGAGTGVASAAAFASSGAGVVNVDVTQMAHSVVGTHATLYGTPFLLSGTGTINVDLGTPPAQATSIAVAISCATAGTFRISVDGKDPSVDTCTAEDARAGHGGSGWQESATGDGDHKLKIIAGSARFVVWASWSSEAASPPMSAAQTAEMADGVVTADEYSAAFDRFSACMTGAGYPLVSVDKSAAVYNYSIGDDAVSAGADTQCYDGEFKQVDIAWQIAHEDESGTAVLLRDCLAAHGVTPAKHMADIQAQLIASGLTLEGCALGK